MLTATGNQITFTLNFSARHTYNSVLNQWSIYIDVNTVEGYRHRSRWNA